MGSTGSTGVKQTLTGCANFPRVPRAPPWLVLPYAQLRSDLAEMA